MARRDRTGVATWVGLAGSMLIASMSVGCDDAERKLGLALLRDLDALRDASRSDLAARELRLEAIAARDHDDPVAKDAKTACLAVFRPQLEAQRELEKATESIKDGKALQDAAERVTQAEEKLEEAEANLPPCELAIAALRLQVQP